VRRWAISSPCRTSFACSAALRASSGRTTPGTARSTRSWELRAATTLARLLEEQEDAAGATAVLAPIYDSFEEGLDTPDLVDAAALRQRLGGASHPSTQEVKP